MGGMTEGWDQSRSVVLIDEAIACVERERDRLAEECNRLSDVSRQLRQARDRLALTVEELPEPGSSAVESTSPSPPSRRQRSESVHTGAGRGSELSPLAGSPDPAAAGGSALTAGDPGSGTPRASRLPWACSCGKRCRTEGMMRNHVRQVPNPAGHTIVERPDDDDDDEELAG